MESSARIDTLEKQIAHLTHTEEPVGDKRDIQYRSKGNSHFYDININDGAQVATMEYSDFTKQLRVYNVINNVDDGEERYRMTVITYNLDEDNIFHLTYLGVFKGDDIAGSMENSELIFQGNASSIRQTLSSDLLHSDLSACHIVDQTLNGSLLNHFMLAMYIHQDMNDRPRFDHAFLDKTARDIMQRKHLVPVIVGEKKSQNYNFRNQQEDDNITQIYEFPTIGTSWPLKMTREFVTQYDTATTKAGQYMVTSIAYDAVATDILKPVPAVSFMMTENETATRASLTGGFGSLYYETGTGHLTMDLRHPDKLGEVWRFISDPRIDAALAPAATFNPDIFYQQIKDMTLQMKNEKIAPLQQELNTLTETTIMPRNRLG